MTAVRLLALPLLAALFLLGPPPLATGAPKAGGLLKVALLRDPTGWDPHINYGATTYTFQNNVYEQLVRHSTKGVLEPGLAVRWETIEVKDGPPERLRVRETSHGPLVAEDFALKWTALDPKNLRLPIANVMSDRIPKAWFG